MVKFAIARKGTNFTTPLRTAKLPQFATASKCTNFTTSPKTSTVTLHKITPTQSKFQHKYIGLMKPKYMALRHPAAQQLLSYATEGCPVKCGSNWTIEEMHAAITCGIHPSSKDPEAPLACLTESLERVNEG